MNMQSPIQMVVNAVRRMENLFPDMGFTDAKHDIDRDFGFLKVLNFHNFHEAFRRNGIASGAIEHTILETWQDYPEICENDDPEETPLEETIRRHFEKIRFWQKIADTDRKSMVGEYAGVILRFRDGKQFNEPAENIRMGIEGLVEVIPAWQGQLKVALWVEDQADENYGQPAMFEFNEARVMNDTSENKNPRQFTVHPSRVVIWSKDGTVHGQSKLESGFNDLTTMKKIIGAGGEGFWKNATGRPILETDKDVKISDVARGMGVSIDEAVEKMDEQVGDFNKNFDNMLWLQGTTAKTLPVNMISPEHPFAVALMSFAASWPIPAKVLVGSQTGERASTEDNDTWKKTNNARRTNIAKPTIMDIIERLVEVGCLPELDWLIKWTDLTEAGMPQKIERAKSMSSINKDQPDEPVFLIDEIRDVLDMAPRPALPDPETDVDGEGDEDIDDPNEDEPTGDEE